MATGPLVVSRLPRPTMRNPDDRNVKGPKSSVEGEPAQTDYQMSFLWWNYILAFLQISPTVS